MCQEAECNASYRVQCEFLVLCRGGRSAPWRGVKFIDPFSSCEFNLNSIPHTRACDVDVVAKGPVGSCLVSYLSGTEECPLAQR